jgi:hypothetical protein
LEQVLEDEAGERNWMNWSSQFSNKSEFPPKETHFRDGALSGREKFSRKT